MPHQASSFLNPYTSSIKVIAFNVYNAYMPEGFRKDVSVRYNPSIKIISEKPKKPKKQSNKEEIKTKILSGDDPQLMCQDPTHCLCRRRSATTRRRPG